MTSPLPPNTLVAISLHQTSNGSISSQKSVSLVLTVTKDLVYYGKTGPDGDPQYLYIYLAHEIKATPFVYTVEYTIDGYLCRVPLHEDAKGPKGVYHKSSSYIVAEHLPLEYLPPVLGHWDASIRDVALRRLAQGT